MVDHTDDPGGLPPHLGEVPVPQLFRHSCGHFWELATWPDGSAYGEPMPVRGRCRVCAALTAFSLVEVIADLKRQGRADGVPRPEPAPDQVKLRVDPNDPQRVSFVRDLLTEDLSVAIGNAVGTWAAHHANAAINKERFTSGSTMIDAIARGIESADKHISNGIAWIATGTTGLPRFPARVLGALIVSATMPPVKGIALGLRVIGATLSCLAGTPDQCACMRSLTAEFIFEQPISNITADVVDKFGLKVAIETPEPPEPDDPPPPRPRDPFDP